MSQLTTPQPRAIPTPGQQQQQQQKEPPQYDYSNVPINELEATRIKLVSLTRSLHRLHEDITSSSSAIAAAANTTTTTTANNNNTINNNNSSSTSDNTSSANGTAAAATSKLLPRWESLHSQYSVIITQLSSLSQEIFQNLAILSARNVFPLPHFPTTQQEGLLNTLLRKKPSPEVSEWIESAQEFVSNLGIDVDALIANENGINDGEEGEKFIEWCLDVIEKDNENHNFFSVYTQEEIDNGDNLKDNHLYKIDRKASAVSAAKQDKPQVGLDVDQALRFMHTGMI